MIFVTVPSTKLFFKNVFLILKYLSQEDLLCFGNTYHQALLTKPMELNVNFHL